MQKVKVNHYHKLRKTWNQNEKYRESEFNCKLNFANLFRDIGDSNEESIRMNVSDFQTFAHRESNLRDLLSG